TPDVNSNLHHQLSLRSPALEPQAHHPAAEQQKGARFRGRWLEVLRCSDKDWIGRADQEILIVRKEQPARIEVAYLSANHQHGNLLPASIQHHKRSKGSSSCIATGNRKKQVSTIVAETVRGKCDLP